MQPDDQNCNRNRELSVPRSRQKKHVEKNRQALNRIDDAEDPIVSLPLLLRKCAGSSLLTAPLKPYRCDDEEQYCFGTLATDSEDHLAVALQLEQSQDGDDGPINGPFYLASYTANSKGNLTTKST